TCWWRVCGAGFTMTCPLSSSSRAPGGSDSCSQSVTSSPWRAVVDMPSRYPLSDGGLRARGERLGGRLVAALDRGGVPHGGGDVAVPEPALGDIETHLRCRDGRRIVAQRLHGDPGCARQVLDRGPGPEPAHACCRPVGAPW